MTNSNYQFRYPTDNQSRKKGASESIPAFEKLLTLIQVDSSLAVNLSQGAEVYCYELGDEIAIAASNHSLDVSNYQLNQSPNSVQGKHDDAIYLICEGHVRLIATDPSKDREVSVSLLEAGEMFGGDRHWTSLEPLPYQAIAASPVSVARLTLNTLKPWLEKFPQWREELQTTTQQRQRLIFFQNPNRTAAFNQFSTARTLTPDQRTSNSSPNPTQNGNTPIKWALLAVPRRNHGNRVSSPTGTKLGLSRYYPARVGSPKPSSDLSPLSRRLAKYFPKPDNRL
jgi:ATP-binding cassette subfamily B protein